MKKEVKGQITVFIILGVVILFAAIFMFTLVKQVETGKLEQEQEKVISRTFSKEGLRLYVEDCLHDELERGLILIGEQGRIWKDQGGTVEFVEGLTGRSYPEGRLFYGISWDNKGYLPENKYPCEDGSEPDFCKYHYPDGSITPTFGVKFGGREISERIIANDLRKFLKERTIWCVENFTRSNISTAATISTEDLVLNLDILSDGIKVEVNYPIRFTLGEEEFFHIANFDFFYVTEFKKLLEAAVTYPLSLDWSFADFDYTEESLESPVFTKGAGTEEERNYTMRTENYFEIVKEFKRESLGADDLFKFTAARDKVIPNEEYLFQFARQNRAPALDYVERAYCDEENYDYLVLSGKEGEMGAVNISLNAWDPDEDEVSFDFSNYTLGRTGSGKEFYSRPVVPGYYNLTAFAEDENGKRDWQVVRVLVDRELETNITIWTPYNAVYQLDDLYLISNEDPVFINVTVPEDSQTTDVPTKIYLNYVGLEESFEIGLPSYDQIAGKTTCYSLPWGVPCGIDSYTSDDLENWKELLETREFGKFKELTSTPGRLNLTFEITYCNKSNQSDSTEVRVAVRECIPQRNEEHPFAYPYHGYIFDNYNFTTGEGVYSGRKDDNSVNPFLTTHSCCRDDGQVLSNTECFINPEPMCFGKITGFTAAYKGYLLEEEFAVCDGKRGNLCGEESGAQYRLLDGKMICGNRTIKCKGVASGCENKLAFGFADVDRNGINDGWCYDTMGCGAVCDQPIVHKVGGGGIFSAAVINGQALRRMATDETTLDFDCGCAGFPDGTPCDDNWDGNFDKTCQKGVCS